MAAVASEQPQSQPLTSPVKVEARDINVYYGDAQALKQIDLDIPRNQVTSLIGPSGCGKSTFLRCINRMNDVIEGCRSFLSNE